MCWDRRRSRNDIATWHLRSITGVQGGVWRQERQFRVVGFAPANKQNATSSCTDYTRAREMRRGHGRGFCGHPRSVVGFGDLAMRQNPSPLSKRWTGLVSAFSTRNSALAHPKRAVEGLGGVARAMRATIGHLEVDPLRAACDWRTRR